MHYDQLELVMVICMILKTIIGFSITIEYKTTQLQESIICSEISVIDEISCCMVHT